MRDRTAPATRRSRLRGIGAVAAGLLGGVALTAGIPALLDGDGDRSAPTLDADLGALASTSPDLSAPGPEAGDSAGADSPEAAVEGFLDAEVEGDLDTSFTFLPAAARTELGSPAAWRAAHARLIAPVTDFEVGEVREAGERAEVAALVDFEPGLDRIVGLTPAQARVRWTVVQEPDGWVIDLESSAMEPILPDDSTVDDAVQAWAEALQRCDGRPPNEHDEGLVGYPARADALCGADGAVRLGRVGPLPEIESSPFTAAFGGDVTTWSRKVAVEAPVGLQVVVAPVGDEWTVIGVL